MKLINCFTVYLSVSVLTSCSSFKLSRDTSLSELDYVVPTDAIAYIGMTKEQVLIKFGSPISKMVENRIETWIYIVCDDPPEPIIPLQSILKSTMTWVEFSTSDCVTSIKNTISTSVVFMSIHSDN